MIRLKNSGVVDPNSPNSPDPLSADAPITGGGGTDGTMVDELTKSSPGDGSTSNS